MPLTVDHSLAKGHNYIYRYNYFRTEATNTCQNGDGSVTL